MRRLACVFVCAFSVACDREPIAVPPDAPILPQLSGEGPAVTLVVTPADLMGWTLAGYIVQNSFDLVLGPGTPPLGAGSAGMRVSEGFLAFGYVGYQALQLADLEALSFSTYVPGSSALATPTFRMNIDYDLSDGVGDFFDWFGQLVYDPALNAPIVHDRWQTWDMLGGRWYGTDYPVIGSCSVAHPCTTAELLTLFPHIGVVAGYFGAVSFWADGSIEPLTSYVDAFRIGNVTWDFDVEDADADGVVGAADYCPNTTADTYESLGKNRWVWDGSAWITNPGGNQTDPYTMRQTRGCSCNQVVAELAARTGESYNGHRKFGCSKSLMDGWIAEAAAGGG